MNIYDNSSTSPDLHREPIEKAICLPIFPPLLLLGYRILQSGSSEIVPLLEWTFLLLLCVEVLYAFYLIYLHWRFYRSKITRLMRELFRYVENEDDETDKGVIDHDSDSLSDYDFLSQFTADESPHRSMV